MSRLTGAILLALGVTAGAVAGYWYARFPAGVPASPVAPESMTAAAERKILYYRDPSGAPNFSAEPKKNAEGRDYLPVYEDEEISFEPGGKKQAPTAGGPRKILYYRNPMGLPDTSPVPKKDWMGMDYIPVYEGEEQDDGKTVKVSLDKIQRSGVRTEAVEARVIMRPVRAVGTVRYDERRLSVVTMRSEGYVEDLFVNTTGQLVREGEPLFRVYSKEIQLAQIDLTVATGAQSRMTGGLGAQTVEGAMQRLRNLAVPDSRIQEVRSKGINPRTLDWPSPTTGTVIDKKIINGQRVMPGEELYRIADLSHLWVIADVAEADLSAIKVGTRATVMVRAYMTKPIEGEVTFVYPELRADTRTARVRIEVPNPDGRLKIDMYADVVFQVGAQEEPVIAVPASAVIDSGTRQVVLVAKGEGRFEPRAVKLGRRGDGYVEVLDGVTKGEEVVTAATFLIDAESNLRAALQAFTQPEAPK
jgi:membrane fusion protein, copper/silver efflux system